MEIVWFKQTQPSLTQEKLVCIERWERQGENKRVTFQRAGIRQQIKENLLSVIMPRQKNSCTCRNHLKLGSTHRSARLQSHREENRVASSFKCCCHNLFTVTLIVHNVENTLRGPILIPSVKLPCRKRIQVIQRCYFHCWNGF